MTPQNLAYLSRYLFVADFLLLAFIPLRASLRDFRNRIRAGRHIVNGFFLMSADEPGSAAEHVRSFPLYHTTTLGSARSSDLCFKIKGVAYRHAVIYIYNGAWYIAPSGSRVNLTVNGLAITDPIPLEDKDVIGIGPQHFIFVNERQAAFDEGLTYQDNSDDFVEPPRQLRTGFAWFLVNVYMVLGSLVMLYLQSGALKPLRQGSLIAFAVYIIIMNLYYLLLPVLLPYVDRAILLAVTQLAFVGLLFQTRFQSLGWSRDELTPEFVARIAHRLQSNAIVLGVCLILLPIIIAICARSNLLEKLTVPMLVLVPVLLIATRVLGHGRSSHGASLWIYIGGMSLQLTEFVKIGFLIVLASFFKNRPPLRKQILFAAWAGLVFALIMLLPDLGSIMVLLPATIVVFFVMTSEYLITFGILVGGSAVSMLIYSIFPYVQSRISGWTTIWSGINDNNAQIIYGLQAVARGGLIGRGLGNGSPAGIPNYLDDMVFTPICEELGLLTGLCLLVLFIVIWLRGARMTMQVRDGFTSSLILGLSTALFVEAAVVISGTTGLIPLTGATLPFIAKGGSSLLAKFIVLGCLLGLGARREGGAKFREKLSA